LIARKIRAGAISAANQRGIAPPPEELPGLEPDEEELEDEEDDELEEDEEEELEEDEDDEDEPELLEEEPPESWMTALLLVTEPAELDTTTV